MAFQIWINANVIFLGNYGVYCYSLDTDYHDDTNKDLKSSNLLILVMTRIGFLLITSMQTCKVSLLDTDDKKVLSILAFLGLINENKTLTFRWKPWTSYQDSARVDMILHRLLLFKHYNTLSKNVLTYLLQVTELTSKIYGEESDHLMQAYIDLGKAEQTGAIEACSTCSHDKAIEHFLHAHSLAATK